jgi:hypothetical protein
VCSGLELTVNSTPESLDLAAGVAFIGTTELTVAADTDVGNGSNDITDMADATNPKWVVVEVNASGVNFNQGTAASAPAFPTISTTRVPLGFIYIPANATEVDTLLTTNNGKAKLYDARNLRSVHPARLIATDVALTSLSNPTTLTTLLASAPSLPANSLSVGDTFVLTASGTILIASGGSDAAMQFALTIGGSGMSNWTTQTFTKSASSRVFLISSTFTVNTLGASGQVLYASSMAVSIAGSQTPRSLANATGGLFNGATHGEGGIGGAGSTTFDTTSTATIDCTARFTTSTTGSTIALRQFSIHKYPV